MKGRLLLITLILNLLPLAEAQWKVPEYVQNYNNALPAVYSDDIGGGAHEVADSLARYAIPIAKRDRGMIVSYIYDGNWKTKRFEGPDTTNSEWLDWENWVQIGTGGGGSDLGMTYNATNDILYSTGNFGSGYQSTAIVGIGNTATDYGQMAVGVFGELTNNVANSITATNVLFVVGNGTDAYNRSNAMEVYQSGYTKLYDSLYLDYLPASEGWLVATITGAVGRDSIENASKGLSDHMPPLLIRLMKKQDGEIAWRYSQNGELIEEYTIRGSLPSITIQKLQWGIEHAYRYIFRLQILILVLMALIIYAIWSR